MQAGSRRILLSAAAAPAVADVRGLLERAGHAVTWHGLGGDEPPDAASYHLAVLDAGRDETEAVHLCRRLRARMDHGFLPLLLLAGDQAQATRLVGTEGGADGCVVRPFAAVELLGQAGAFLRIKDLHDRLAEKTAEVHRINRRLHQAYQQIDQELELARRIQLSFLPQTLPQVPQARFAVHYRLCGRVGGDFYDLFRLDEGHVGLYVADAMGHGVPASLLTIFVKKGVRPKEVFGQHYRLVPPAEVLQRLNRDLVEQALSDSPFITMIYGLYNHRERRLHFARAGHPYPLYVPHDDEPRFWQVAGSLLGVFDTEYVPQSHTLRPGDKVLFYSDGIDAARLDGQADGGDSLRACALRHRGLPVEEFVAALARDLFREAEQPDDLTLLGMEVTGA